MESDLISRSTAMNTLSDVFGIPLDYDGECNEMCDEAFAAIEALPVVDAVPVVRCIECKFRGDTFYCPLTVNINCGNGFRAVFAGADNDFCSKGARMDGESEEER